MADTDDVVWMVYGAWVSLSVRAACELGVVDALDSPDAFPTSLAERPRIRPRCHGCCGCWSISACWK